MVERLVSRWISIRLVDRSLARYVNAGKNVGMEEVGRYVPAIIVEKA